MKSTTYQWIPLTLDFNDRYHDALQQQHHAAQFIALAGRYLIPQEPDDSNTNMSYNAEKHLLLGNRISDSIYIGLDLFTLELYLFDVSLQPLHSINPAGKKHNQVFEQFKNALSDTGIDTSKLVDKMHYEIPQHAVSKGHTFNVEQQQYFRENASGRHNGDFILKNIVSMFKNAAPVRIWPHHFDSGTIIPLAHNEKGSVSKSIGLGWAIPDEMVAEPYFYLSYWSEKPAPDFNQLPPIEEGQWISSGWQGAVLRLSDILKENDARVQYEKTRLFFNSGISILQDSYSQ